MLQAKKLYSYITNNSMYLVFNKQLEWAKYLMLEEIIYQLVKEKCAFLNTCKKSQSMW